MDTNRKLIVISTILVIAAVNFSGCSSSTGVDDGNQAVKAEKTYKVVEPGTHPSIVFCKKEIPKLKKRAQSEGLAGDMWRKIKELSNDWTMRGEWYKRGMEINAKALIYQVNGDEQAGQEALAMFKEILDEVEPFSYYEKEVDSDFFETEHWPKAFAFAYDWLYELMSEEERAEIVDKLEIWCKALYEHTESWWWRNASINCGAIPVGALGMLCLAIQAEADHPEFDKWFVSALRRLRDNYARSWRASGICLEGPCYAHYHKNPTMFGIGLRRTGGPDIIANSGAVNGMHYQRFQWMPQGECGPVGDNTSYSRRVFQSIYLYGIGEMNDGPGLWTFEKYTARDRLNPIYAFLFYPDQVESVSPGSLDLPTSYYFEITPHRAGYVYSRSEWDNERAHWFAFVTRYESFNHQHYDMNSFLFIAFGEEFATHRNIFPYSHALHGADIEHNMVIVDEGGMPGSDPVNGAGDDCSSNGYMKSVGLGHFADYVRGEARRSYVDRSVPDSRPALRADRYGVFVKQGPNPYVVMIDDIQKSKEQHDYHWQLYTKFLEATGSGTLDDPILIQGESADCAVAFLEPEIPEHEFKVVKGGNPRHPLKLGLIRINKHGSRVRFVSVGTAWEKGTQPPEVRKGPAVQGNPDAVSLVIEGQGYQDLLVWQPEEVPEEDGKTLTCGVMKTDGFLSMVRIGPEGRVLGYVLGDGKNFEHGDQVIVQAPETVSVSADSRRTWVTGRRRTRQGLPPLAAQGKVYLPDSASQLYVDGARKEPEMTSGRVALIGG